MEAMGLQMDTVIPVFAAPAAFEWSPTAEEQLRDRLGKLLGP
jgi:phosphatidylserine decarboxylase